MVGAPPVQFSTQGASVSFGSTRALRQIDLSIEKGEQVALIGPSGSGKSTLLRLLGTALDPDSGVITALGQTPQDLRPGALRRLRSQLAFIPQSLGLVPNVRVLANVLNGRIGQRSLPGQLRSLISPGKAERQEAFDLLGRVGIAEKIYDITETLSGGQQQRVAIARSLFQEPQALLADEPVSALDPRTSSQVIDLLTDLASEFGFTLIVSLHDLDLARSRFSRLIGLKDGEIAFDAAPDSIDEATYTELFAAPDPQS